jgi:hypothetical protein
MGMQITADTQVRRDNDGVVRQLSHARRPYRPGEADPGGFAAAPMTPRALADQYVRAASDVFQFAPEMTGNLAAAAGFSPSQAGVELRFKEEKTMENAVTVSYDQTALGLPIWEAGMTVRIHGGEMGVTGSHNATHYEVAVQPPPPSARYLPHSMDLQTVTGLLGISDTESLVINSTRALIYRYTAGGRIDSQVTAHESAEASGFTEEGTTPFPMLPIPPVPPAIEDGKHYVVTEVMFTLPRQGWGPLNWRVFVEPVNGVVLYLRALVSCARGSVFLSDPVSLSGTTHTAATAADVLDLLRSPGPLLGLAPAGNVQQLRGEYVRLVNIEAPGTPIPAEPAPFDFVYSCNTDQFAACSAYHHCDGFFRLLQGMGIDVATYFNNTDFPLPVDPHAVDGEVNARANGNTQGNGMGPMVFGVAKAGSKFGIAADVRVVIHEFGHGVLWDHVDWPNFGFAHSPGDSLAVILHDPTSKAPDRFESFPFMKSVISRRHDRRVDQGWAWFGPRYDIQYRGEQVLSTTLFRVYRAAGGDSANPADRIWASRYVSYLILKAVSFLQFTTPDPDVYVAALTEADATTGLFEGHPGGAFSKVFRWSFEKQGLYQPAGTFPPVTTEGQPPEVDVYIDDGRAGAYMPYQQSFAGDAEIWNRLTGDGNTAHQVPVVGVGNFAYVRVRNRGTDTATGVIVRGFQCRSAGPLVWPTDWKPLSPSQLGVPDIAAGGEAIVGPFPWTPHYEGATLLFGASADGDRSNLETITTGPIANARFVPLDNNTAQRTF